MDIKEGWSNDILTLGSVVAGVMSILMRTKYGLKATSEEWATEQKSAILSIVLIRSKATE